MTFSVCANNVYKLTFVRPLNERCISLSENSLKSIETYWEYTSSFIFITEIKTANAMSIYKKEI